MAVEEKGVILANGTRELDLRIRFCKMNENEHCRLCRVASLPRRKRFKKRMERGLRVPGCDYHDLSRVGRRWRRRMAHRLKVKERTAAVEGPKPSA